MLRAVTITERPSRSTAVETILVVDDHPAMRELVRDLLAAPGRRFLEGANGCEAVDSFQSNHPDWVVMDLDMPKMDGLSATRAICGADPSARIVIVTQHDEAGLHGAAIAAGAASFLTKDRLFDLPALLNQPDQP